jgi:sulfur relay (sulfurtransferase) DsrC/TusE family protein
MIDETKCLYGFLRLTTKIDLSVATKFVYVHFLGEKIPLAKRGKFSVVHGNVVKHFQPFHVDFDITEKSEMSLKLITEKIEHAAGNANYVRSR